MLSSKDSSSAVALLLLAQVNYLAVLSCPGVNLCLKNGGDWAGQGSLSLLPSHLLSHCSLSHGTIPADQNQGPHITRVIGMKGKIHSLFNLHKSI